MDECFNNAAKESTASHPGTSDFIASAIQGTTRWFFRPLEAEALELIHHRSCTLMDAVEQAAIKTMNDPDRSYEIDDDDELYDSIEAARDPATGFEVESFAPLMFSLQADVLIDDAYDWETLDSQIQDALIEGFSFDKRDFGQPVTGAEVVQVIHSIDGVVAVDLNELYITEAECR